MFVFTPKVFASKLESKLPLTPSEMDYFVKARKESGARQLKSHLSFGSALSLAVEHKGAGLWYFLISFLETSHPSF